MAQLVDQRTIGNQPFDRVGPDVESRSLVHNRTPWEIRLNDEFAGELIIPALGERIIDDQHLEPFHNSLQRLRRRHQVRVRPYREPTIGVLPPIAYFWLAIFIALATVGWLLFEGGDVERWMWMTPLTVSLLLIVWSMLTAVRIEWRRQKTDREADRAEGDVEYGVGGEFVDGNDFNRKIWQLVTLVGVLAIGAALPALALYFGTELRNNLHITDGISIDADKDGEVISRLIQMTYLAVLSLTPALMYFQFDRVRVGTLRGQWVRSIFRLDGRVHHLADVQARYGDRLTEASNNSADGVRFLGGRRSPILLATILIALGWTLLVLQTQPTNFLLVNDANAGADRANEAADEAMASAQAAAVAGDSAADGDAGAVLQEQEAAATAIAAAEAAEDASRSVQDAVAAGTEGTPAPESEGDEASEPATPDAAGAEAAASAAQGAAQTAEQARRELSPLPFFQLLNPRPSPAAMAFLGAYFFALYVVLRGYLRGDLRPKIYNQITVRLITVVIVGYLLAVIADKFVDRTLLLGASFIAGVMPISFLRRFGELPNIPSWLGSMFGRTFAEERPLTLIDGLDVYDRERLSSEGVSDIEALAHHDPVITMVNTRLPPERLMDWTDQALLVLHAQPALDEGTAHLSERVKILRRAGIRSATDLVRVTEAGGPIKDAIEQQLRADDGLDLGTLVDSIRAEASYWKVFQWNTGEFSKCDAKRHYIDGWGELRPFPTSLPEQHESRASDAPAAAAASLGA